MAVSLSEGEPVFATSGVCVQPPPPPSPNTSPVTSQRRGPGFCVSVWRRKAKPIPGVKRCPFGRGRGHKGRNIRGGGGGVVEAPRSKKRACGKRAGHPRIATHIPRRWGDHISHNFSFHISCHLLNSESLNVRLAARA